MSRLPLAIPLLVWLAACQSDAPPTQTPTGKTDAAERLAKYTTVRLTTDLDALSPSDRDVLRHLIGAAQYMHGAFWIQAYGDEEELMASIDDPDARRFAEINFGPWDRLADNEPFLPWVGAKRAGANFYPEDMTREEFEEAVVDGGPEADALRSLYTMVRRDEQGKLTAIPYSEFFAEPFERAANELQAASHLAEDEGLKNYLVLRSKALMSNEYQESDLAWMDMTDNTLDIVVGPIETYEDQLFGYKAGAESFVLVKDQEWSARLSRYAALLPRLQSALPVQDEYKAETPGLGAQLNAYDVVYYAGEANAGSKAIAVNLPNDEQVQLEKGTRRLQLKNTLRAKFDKILIPIAEVLIAEDQLQHIDFDAFFANVMFHEVAHGLGIKNTITGEGTVRQALKERASPLEEAKADVLGLFMITMLAEWGELGYEDLESNYVTFIGSIFRSIRFGGATAHGRANVMQLNFLAERGAFVYEEESGTYRVELARMPDAINELAGVFLRFQGDGDYEGLGAFMETYGGMDDHMQESLDRLSEEGIPVDIVFEQGPSVLGLPTSE